MNCALERCKTEKNGTFSPVLQNPLFLPTAGSTCQFVLLQVACERSGSLTKISPFLPAFVQYGRTEPRDGQFRGSDERSKCHNSVRV